MTSMVISSLQEIGSYADFLGVKNKQQNGWLHKEETCRLANSLQIVTSKGQI